MGEKMEPFDAKFARRYVDLNSTRLEIPAETSVQALARDYGVELELRTLLAEQKRQSSGYRRSAETHLSLLERVCTPQPNLVLPTGSPQIHDYDEKHLLVDGLSSVDVDGKVVESYPRLLVMKDVFRNEDGGVMKFTPDQAILHCQENDYFLPSPQLTCNFLAAIFLAAVRREPNGTYKVLDTKLKRVLDQYKDLGDGYGYHALNGLIDYKNGNIISYPHAPDFALDVEKGINSGCERITLPFEQSKKRFFRKDIHLQSMGLQQGLKDELMRPFLRQFSGLANVYILDNLGDYFAKPSRVWVSSSKKTRAAWFGCVSGSFYLVGNYDLGYYDAARGARL